MVSGGSDRNIIIWHIYANSSNTVNAKVFKIIKTTSGKINQVKFETVDVLDLLLMPNDRFLVYSTVEGNVTIYKMTWEEKKFDFVGDYNLNSKFVSSIISEPVFSSLNSMESMIKLATQVRIKQFFNKILL